jgi:hypothetical protein
MRDLVNAFHEGGSTMYLILMFALAAHVVAIVALVFALPRPSRERLRLFGGASLGLAVVVLALGWFGQYRGLQMVERALAGVDPQIHAALRAQGEKEAGRNLTFGLYACALPALVGAALLARGLTAAPERDPALPPS